MRTILFLFALLPWASAQSTSTSLDSTEDPSITLQSPGNVQSCASVNVTWVASGFNTTRVVPFTIRYTNEGTGDTVAKTITGVATAVTDATKQIAPWKVNIPTPGRYILAGNATGVDIYSSGVFTVAVSNTSCLNDNTTATTSTSKPTAKTTKSPSVNAPTGSVASADPSEVPVGNRNTSRIASMVGVAFGAVIFVALLAAFFFYRRQRSLKMSANADSKLEKPKGHRRWGGLSSVDTSVAPEAPEAPEGIPTVPYSAPVYANSRGDSLNKSPAEDDAVEEGKPVNEMESPSDEVPTLSPRSYDRHSNGAPSATLAQQNSRLAALNNERARTSSLNAVSPATSFVEDPFSDALPRARGIRSKSLSVPSTAHPSPRSFNESTLQTTPTQESPTTPRPGESGGSESLASPSASATMRRTPSARSGRPTRKPVPQYDPSIEMTVTTLSAQPGYLQHSAQNSVTNLTSDSHHTALSSSACSTTPWLIERAPLATRNIGLASQSDGPVHYLMPDMPPPSRD